MLRPSGVFPSWEVIDCHLRLLMLLRWILRILGLVMLLLLAVLLLPALLLLLLLVVLLTTLLLLLHDECLWGSLLLLALFIV